MVIYRLYWPKSRFLHCLLCLFLACPFIFLCYILLYLFSPIPWGVPPFLFVVYFSFVILLWKSSYQSIIHLWPKKGFATRNYPKITSPLESTSLSFDTCKWMGTKYITNKDEQEANLVWVSRIFICLSSRTKMWKVFCKNLRARPYNPEDNYAREMKVKWLNHEVEGSTNTVTYYSKWQERIRMYHLTSQWREH